MKKALTLTSGVYWWRLLTPLSLSHSQPITIRASHKFLPITSTTLEKYLNFTRRVHTHSEASVHERESTDRSSETAKCNTELTCDVKSDSGNGVLKANAPNDVMSKLKVSKRHDLAMIFTCKVCETRSMKTCSRESYEKGVVVVRCGGCNNLHLMADRLGWFGDPGSVEELLAAHGDLVKKGSVDSLNFTLEDFAGKKL